ncbi:MAG: DNA translocase FtsK 4TM domain-containing protein [Eubacteriales bacterium]|nr:DNA translocase FtsK 4TM domain-containing protein [Eubacteriales bacterium]
MAGSAQSGRKKPSASPGRGARKNNSRKNAAEMQAQSAITNEIILIGVFALTILLFLCNFGVVGVVGDHISRVMFGIFGLTAYAVPVLAFVAIAFGISNQGSRIAVMKLTAGILLFLMAGMVFSLIFQDHLMAADYSLPELYSDSAGERTGGGVLAGSLAWVLHRFLGMVGTVLLILVLAIICTVIITERSFVSGVKSSGRYVYETARTDAQLYRERSEKRREEMQERNAERRRLAEERNRQRAELARARREESEARMEERRRRREEEQARQDAEQILRMSKKPGGVMAATDLRSDAGAYRRADMHEITLKEPAEEAVETYTVSPAETLLPDPAEAFAPEPLDMPKTPEPAVPEFLEPAASAAPELSEPEDPELLQTERETEPEAPEGDWDVYRDMREIRPDSLWSASAGSSEQKTAAAAGGQEQESGEDALPWRTPGEEDALAAVQRAPVPGRERPRAELSKAPRTAASQTVVGQQLAREKRAEKPYQRPPLSLLHKSAAGDNPNSGRELKETAARLQETLQTFGVRVTITDISKGPTVTRYELQPEQGVKVSRILSLTDDIKLNLAATDIRIEAPIPGKAAVGIEVPNKENTAVGLRELLETKEFQEFPSRLAFAVGKDIGGKVVVSDIAKMPHMLIAGSTGSGKSVCINTLIMSILYKADPREVKLILVDPKVVELSVYNGIPHLLIPVVTDPRKASAALQWGVAEMTDRYKRFADYNVRDLKGYNQKLEERRRKGEADLPPAMPQIVIIVDELADLMMVASGEVEESICRLAQLARAAGIHLIIATQRPSVDVITGLIKANMPSRVAFAVSSSVDSRTILDMNGAEKLLGKGDMLFYPQGYVKPVRVQGAFVSDGEVSAVVDFLKNQAVGNVYNEDVAEKLKNMESSSGTGGSGEGSEYDEYFEKAAQFIIDKDKASIGMLQRVFKIGFNRAARIMDQLAQAGVVGEEEGTKPRKVLMSPEQFEQFVEENL